MESETLTKRRPGGFGRPPTKGVFKPGNTAGFKHGLYMKHHASNTGRKGGGQLGNKNALRHGLYAQRITEAEKNKMGLFGKKDLNGEIGYYRAICSRMARILEKNGLQ